MKTTPIFEKLPFEIELISDLIRELSISHRDDEGFCKNCLQYGSYKHSSSCEIGNLLKLAAEYVNDNKPRLDYVGIRANNCPMDLASCCDDKFIFANGDWYCWGKIDKRITESCKIGTLNSIRKEFGDQIVRVEVFHG